VRGSSLVFLSLLLAQSASAQSWQFDARRIAIGGASGDHSVAGRVLAGQRGYRVIVLPLGLIQVVRERQTFNPDSDQFDLIKAIEYASSPLHYTFGRGSSESSSGREFVVDIRNATLSRDLNAYRGVELANQPAAEGLAAPTWGITIPVFRGDAVSHEIFVGAGPYLAMRTALAIDERVIQTLNSESNIYFPNAQLQLGNDTRGQAALALTGGYRGRVGLQGRSVDDGVYVALDYHYLRGFRFEDVGTRLQLTTDANGLLGFSGAAPPLVVSRTHASSGQGVAIDVGVAVIAGGWEAGGAIDGIANRITWHDARRRVHVLADPFSGNDQFFESPEAFVGDIRADLPVDYRIHGGRHAGPWSALAEYARGFNGDSFRGGFEYRLGGIDLRGGGFYGREQWQPTGGIGLNFGPRVSLDLALFGTSANAARERRTAIAASLRFNRADAVP
jgi:hypothetical protein